MMNYNYYGNSDCEIIAGSTQNIKALYKSLVKQNKAWNYSHAPIFGNFPKFSEDKDVYGILFEEDGFRVVNSDSIMSWLMAGEIEEVA